MAENHDPVTTDPHTPEAAERTGGASAEGCPVVHGRVHPTQGDANSRPPWSVRPTSHLFGTAATRKPT